MQIIQKIADWAAEQAAWDDDAEASTEYNGMMRCSNFTHEGGAEVLPRSSDSRCVRAR
ncbi:hypothetical protein [Pseudomonas brassicacearum]|uniref:hypothetical protein n=1 Tax=Pseudomonas brassicacearum TaxID=930166 RepID=UPI001BDF55ED|nr:hypothetical protein [Pseudomonas brassicacearum]